MAFSIEKYITDANQAESVDALLRALECQFHHLGVRTFLISLLNDHPTFGLHARHGILRSYPEDWMKYYFKQSYHRIDPVRIQCYKVGAFSWEKLMQENLFSYKQRRMMDEAREAGLKHGVAVGVCSFNGQYSGVGFASDVDMEVTKNRLDLLELIAVHFTRCFLNLTALNGRNVDTQEVPTLTPQQHEVLKWIAAGLLPHEAADKLALNKRTVDFHLENIYRKLKVYGRAQAISKALQLGIVQVYPEPLESS